MTTRTTGSPTSVSTWAMDNRSTRRPPVRWSLSSPYSAASGATTSPAVAASAAQEPRSTLHEGARQVADTNAVVHMFMSLLDFARAIGLTAAALFLAWSG